jgi:hypothetical protein
LTGVIFDRAENPVLDMDADVSTRISDRPGSAGQVRQRVLQCPVEGVPPAQRRRLLVPGQEPVGELPRPRHLLRIGQALGDLLGHLVGHARLVEVAQVAQQGHVAHRRRQRRPQLRLVDLRPGQRQRLLPRHAGRLEYGRVEQVVVLPAVGVLPQLRVEMNQRQRRRDVAAAVAAVECVLEQRALPWRLGARVDQVDDVGEAEAVRVGVVLQQRVLAVEPHHRVGDAALDRLRDGPAVLAGPVGEQLARLVGALQDGVDHLAVESVGGVGPLERVVRELQPGVYRLRGADQRRRAHVGLGAQPPQEPQCPVRIGHGDLRDELLVARVPLAGLLVEGVLADHVGHRQQEQFALGIAGVAGRAFVGAARRRRLGDDRPRGADASVVPDVELRHEDGLLSEVGGREEPVMRRE